MSFGLHIWAIIGIAILILFALCLIAAFRHEWRDRQNQHKTINELFNSLGIAKFKSGKEYQATLEGVNFHIAFTKKFMQHSSVLKIRVPCNSPAGFMISKENKMDQFAKRTEISKELQTGYIDFDREFYISTDKEESTLGFLSDPLKRAAVKDILSLGIPALSLHHGMLEIVKCPFNPTKEENKDLVQIVVRKMKILRDNLPEYYDSTIVKQESRAGDFFVFSFLIGFVMLITGFISHFVFETLYTPLNKGEIIKYSLQISIPCFLCFMALAFLLLKERSSTHVQLIGLFVVCILAFPLVTNATVLFINGYYDPGEITYHRVSIKKAANSYFVLESWREGREFETIEVSSKDYKEAVIGQSFITVATKPGKLGFPWIVSYSISKKQTQGID